MDRFEPVEPQRENGNEVSVGRGARVAAVTIAAAVACFGLACSDEGAAPSKPAAQPTSNATPPPTPAVPKPAPSEPVEPVADTRTPEELVADGRAVYMANCIACHALDATIDGALGPAVSGSSLELLEARVLRGEYPEGYEPKRPSRVMVPLPHLEPKLPELAAYLQSL